jgi:hypothetical protein
MTRTVKGADEKIEEVLANADRPADAAQEQPMEIGTHPDRTREMTHPSLSRMRTDWVGDDALRMAEVRGIADQIIKEEFRVAFAVMDRLHRHVRSIALNTSDGSFQYNPDGTPIWEEDELGAPVENWSQLSDSDRDNLLYTITAFLFEWELMAVDKWAQAMFSKVQWEEKFAKGFIMLPGMSISGKPTIHDRTEWGHQFSAEERYFAVFQSVLSRKADAVVRSMTRLQRLLENRAGR